MQPHKIVSREEWTAARKAHLAREKELTRARDRLAAERRELPWVKLEKTYVFDGPDGKQTLADLFGGRSQLIVNHFMLGPGWKEGCIGCSFGADNVEGALQHLEQRDVAYVAVSRAPLAEIEAYRKRMGWQFPWYSSAGNDFNADFGMTTAEGENHGLSVFLRDGWDIYRTYFTTARGLEYLGSTWSFFDITPYGRQEIGEDSPPGWPQTPPLSWWHRHDEYGQAKRPQGK
jgi:predicted dithiol-disulfide oxidoreductase (DUF899 family)